MTKALQSQFASDHSEPDPSTQDLEVEQGGPDLGRKTTKPSNGVDQFQSDAGLFWEDSWLQRRAPQIMRGFLAEEEGRPFAEMDPSTRKEDPEFRQAFCEFKNRIMRRYLTLATYVVEQNARANLAAGLSGAEVRDKAVEDALAYTNVYAYATPHITLEAQDEAVVQKALQALGLDLNADADIQDQRLSKKS